jgi:transposase
MNFATKSFPTRILVWLIWFIALIAFTPPTMTSDTTTTNHVLLGVVNHDSENGPLFPWRPRYRWKKHALRKYRAWQRAYRRAKWAAHGARLVMTGAVTLAQLADWVTLRQQHYQIGSLPVLYALLETLQVRHIINRHCPTRGEVEHGIVALVLVLNRLIFPLPLYRVADWVGRTTLVHVLGIPAAKFNDDRLERTLDALYPHLETIWLEVVAQAMLKADIDLSVIFYDLTAFIAHGRYTESKQVDFGFAHNTPMNKRKFKLSLNATADGNIPWLYRFWSGRTADQATVASNMNNMATWLKGQGYSLSDTLVVGDRAMLNDEIALAYDQYDLRYLAGLRCLRTKHQELLTQWTTQQFMDFPLEEGANPQYWGRGCTVTFKHEGRTVRHQGLVILAGPLREQLRQSRQIQLDALEQELTTLKAKLGQPYYRTVKGVQRSANARCRESKVGRFMAVHVYQSAAGQVDLQWQIDTHVLRQVEEKEGRYLLVTNQRSLSHQEMFALYRQKDGVEKRFHICKSDLKVSPVYLHQDKRIAAMLLLNMIALLAYSLLERQVRQHGLQLTTRQLIKRLETLTLIKTHCRDGSCLRRLTPVEPEVALVLQLVAEALTELMASPAISKMQLLVAGSSEPPPLFMDRLC